MRRASITLAALSAALALTSALLWRDRNAERERADALESQLAAMRRPVEAQATPIQSAAAAGSAASAPGASPTPTPITPEDDRPPPTSSNADTEARLLRDPKYREAKRAARRMELTQKFSDYQRLGLQLPPDQGRKLVDFWVDTEIEHEMNRMAAPLSAEEQADFARRHERRRAEEEARLRGVLGDEGYTKYQDFMASRPSRNQVTSLRTQLGPGSNAMRDDQYEPLVAVLHEERTRLERQILEYVESSNFGADPSLQGLTRAQEHVARLTAESHGRMHDGAATILSPQQLAALDAMFERERDIERARGAVLRLQMQARPSATPD
jgi:hypothetical protein